VCPIWLPILLLNQDWVQESILAWLWHHFHIALIGWDSNPQPSNFVSSLLTTRSDFRLFCILVYYDRTLWLPEEWQNWRELYSQPRRRQSPDSGSNPRLFRKLLRVQLNGLASPRNTEQVSEWWRGTIKAIQICVNEFILLNCS